MTSGRQRVDTWGGVTTITITLLGLFSFTSQKYLIQTTDVSVAIQLPSSMHKTVKHPRASLSTKHIKTAGKKGRGMAGEL